MSDPLIRSSATHDGHSHDGYLNLNNHMLATAIKLGKMSDIYSSYKKSLDLAQDQYEESLRTTSSNAREFYTHFFRDLVINMGQRLEDLDFRETIAEEAEKFFGKRELNFVAVDGSCHKHKSNEFVSFYGGAYGAKGMLTILGGKATVEYKRWEIEKDVSMVAFVPIPYNRLTEVEDDNRSMVSEEDRRDPAFDLPAGRDDNQFVISEEDRIELSSMHLPIMQLAEVFLAYNVATSSNLDGPNIILMDNSLSGMLGYTDFSPDKVRLKGCVLSDGSVLEKHDVAVAQAHPFNTGMGIPSGKKFSQRFAVIKFMHEYPHQSQTIKMEDLGSKTGILDIKRLRSIVNRLDSDGIIAFDGADNIIRTKVNPYESWERTKSMFQGMCKAIFLDKRPDALKYKIRDHDAKTTTRWMAPDDVRFLIAVGLRALVEECWNRKILLIGIAKDSASTYLTKNYLGVCRYLGQYRELSEKSFGALPPTDRMLCELLPYLDDGLTSPWGSIEFDSTFMTLRTGLENGSVRLGGTFTGITRPERLFMRSIGQFYTRRHTESPLTGHAIFIDRLTFQEWDGKAQAINIDTSELGTMSPLFHPTNKEQNIGQLVTYFLLDTLTKNHFAEMIGYPDPLHKADQGAKSMRDSVKKLLDSSEIKFRSRPLINTLREIRNSFGR